MDIVIRGGRGMKKMPQGAYFPPHGTKLCLDCYYARMRTDICGIYCTGGFVVDGKCEKFKPYRSRGRKAMDGVHDLQRLKELQALPLGRKVKIEEPILFYPYPTAYGYRCFDGKEWKDCDKDGKPHERK